MNHPRVTTFLAIESSCDETAVSILRGEPGTAVEVLASEVASQIAEHREHGGVVPEVASRSHSLSLKRIIESALETGNIHTTDIDVFGATMGPGLASSLLIGSTAAKSMSCLSGKPFVGINHLEGHLLSPFIDRTDVPKHIGLIISGGHTLLMKVNTAGDYERLGSTRDDAAGEAFDKVGKMLGLPYPGGPEIEKIATSGNPRAFDFPRSMLHDGGLDFSFSGLKTAVLYTLEKQRDLKTEDVAASFQAAVTEVLVEKTVRAARRESLNTIGLSGGVSLNSCVRDAFSQRCEKEGIELFVSKPEFCTDNAAMIAFAGLLRFFAGRIDQLNGDIDPNLKL
ncbi:MAG: tRNA (adenosine(37)-N6)-threonylcarbamoyltransferase complex transferase subunit TsaD [Akkermansiaceae bacterium]